MSSLLLFMLVARAHNPDIAVFDVHQEPDGWVLRTSMSAHGLHKALRERSRTDPGLLSADEYSAEAEAALRSGITLVIDGRYVPLGPATVQLGGHHSEVSFALPSLLQAESLVGTHVIALSQVPNQHNVLRLTSFNDVQQWVLAERNSFGLTAKVVGGRPASELPVLPVPDRS